MERPRRSARAPPPRSLSTYTTASPSAGGAHAGGSGTSSPAPSRSLLSHLQASGSGTHPGTPSSSGAGGSSLPRPSRPLPSRAAQAPGAAPLSLAGPPAKQSAFASRIAAGCTTLLRPLPAEFREGQGATSTRARPTYRDHDESGDSEESDEEVAGAGRDEGGAVAEGDCLGQPCPPEKVRLVKPKRNRLKYTHEADLAAQASRREILVPITLEIETPRARISDVVTWNLRERHITPLQFARTFVADLNLESKYASELAASIVAQLEDAVQVNVAWEEDVRPWDEEGEDSDEDEDGEPEVEDDLRVAVAYETPILSSHLSDRLEWDLASRLTPEEFARGVARDLGLTGEALPLISNAVREQIMRHRRSALELQLLGSGRQWAEGVRMLEDAGRLERGEIVDLPDDTVDAQGETQEPLDPVRRAAQLRYEGHAILNDLAFRGPKPLEGVWREFGAPFGPVLQELNTEERERSFVEYMRELRRARRTTGGTRSRRR